MTQSQTDRCGELPSQSLLTKPGHGVDRDPGLKTWITQGRRDGIDDSNFVIHRDNHSRHRRRRCHGASQGHGCGKGKPLNTTNAPTLPGLAPNEAAIETNRQDHGNGEGWAFSRSP